MKPYIKDPSKPMGGSTEALKYMWGFQRRDWARIKRDSRRKKRQADKQELKKEL